MHMSFIGGGGHGRKLCLHTWRLILYNYSKIRRSSIMKRIFRGNLAIALLVASSLGIVLVGCGNSKNPTKPSGPEQTTSVSISNFAFSPSSIQVSVGDTVTWTNNQNVNHTVTSDQGSELNSPSFGQGQTYKHVFMTAGTYPYHCSLHTSMKGSVTVQ